MEKVPYINFTKQHNPLKKEMLSALEKVIDHGQFILGPDVETFEENFAHYCGTRYAIGVNSGTDALFLTLRAFDIGLGDEVITAPSSFLATASSIIATGAKPVFVDIRSDLNMNPSLIEKIINSKTKAILPVHMTGKPADMAHIVELAKKYNLLVIEDAAQAVGASYHGKRVGSLGDVGCFSLHPLKTLNACGDGGVITTDDKKIAGRLRQLRNIGLKNRDESEIWGYNSRLDSMQAALLNLKLNYIDSWNAKRRQNAQFYREKLSQWVEVPEETETEEPVYHTFIIQTDKRDPLKEFLERNGIETKVHYPIPIHLQEAAKPLGYKEGDFPMCERAAKRILSLPIYQDLSQEDLQKVVVEISRFFKQNS